MQPLFSVGCDNVLLVRCYQTIPEESVLQCVVSAGDFCSGDCFYYSRERFWHCTYTLQLFFHSWNRVGL